MDQAVFDGIQHELMGDEGLVLKVYDDKTGKPIGPGSVLIGNPTIAIGRNLTARGVSHDEALYLNSNDINALWADLIGQFPWFAQLSAGRQIAVGSLYFNVALGNVAKFVTGWPNFLEQMRTGQYDAAATNLETSQPWAGEVGPRAKRLGELIRSG